MKSGNGRFYPAVALTGTVIGDDDYNAGHAYIADCRMTLPEDNWPLACFKRANGRYFPTSVATGAVVGSTDYNAGYVYFKDYAETLH